MDMNYFKKRRNKEIKDIKVGFGKMKKKPGWFVFSAIGT